MFLSRSTEKQAGHDLYWFTIDLLLIDSKYLAELILCIFFSCIPWNEFCVYLACIYFRECRLKENFAFISFCEIDQNSQNKMYTKNLYN